MISSTSPCRLQPIYYSRVSATLRLSKILVHTPSLAPLPHPYGPCHTYKSGSQLLPPPPTPPDVHYPQMFNSQHDPEVDPTMQSPNCMVCKGLAAQTEQICKGCGRASSDFPCRFKYNTCHIGFTHLGTPCRATIGTVTYYCQNNTAGIPQGRLGVAVKQPLPPSRSPIQCLVWKILTHMTLILKCSIWTWLTAITSKWRPFFGLTLEGIQEQCIECWNQQWRRE